MRHIGDRVRDYRLRRDLSVAQVAMRVNRTVRYVEMIEAGTRTPSVETLDRLATALNVSMASLVSDDDPERLASK